ncbi:hypothetical protein C8R46DRAFT_1355790 [Mycena filopes]|nr:hypothetical protein C8R46DRAFT_1355790 [Mycena filopes]
MRSPTHKSKSAARTPRPPNAFFLFKSSLPIGAIASFTPGEQISTVAGLRWRGLSESERQNWMDLARQKAKEHKVKYPDYKFTPQRGAARTTRQRDPDPARCNHIASLLAQGLTESALRDEMEIFDKTRPPRAAVFEFASPILAESYQTFAAGSATALPLNCADEPNVSPIGAPNGIESSEGALYHGGPTVSLNSAPLEFVPASTSCFVAAAPGYALSSPDLNTGSLLHRPQDMDAFGATAPLFMSNLFKFIGLSAPPTSTELEDFFGMLSVLTPLAGLPRPHPLGIIHIVDATDPHRLNATPPHTPRRTSAHDADSSVPAHA